MAFINQQHSCRNGNPRQDVRRQDAQPPLQTWNWNPPRARLESDMSLLLASWRETHPPAPTSAQQRTTHQGLANTKLSFIGVHSRLNGFRIASGTTNSAQRRTAASLSSRVTRRALHSLSSFALLASWRETHPPAPATAQQRTTHQSLANTKLSFIGVHSRLNGFRIASGTTNSAQRRTATSLRSRVTSRALHSLSSFALLASWRETHPPAPTSAQQRTTRRRLANTKLSFIGVHSRLNGFTNRLRNDQLCTEMHNALSPPPACPKLASFRTHPCTAPQAPHPAPKLN